MSENGGRGGPPGRGGRGMGRGGRGGPPAKRGRGGFGGNKSYGGGDGEDNVSIHIDWCCNLAQCFRLRFSLKSVVHVARSFLIISPLLSFSTTIMKPS